jgi:lipopolysaccharide transport system permease protein
LTTDEIDRPPLPAPPPLAEPPRDGPPELVLRPTSAWRLIDLRELWRYRELLFFLAWRDVKIRYKQTALGLGWAVLQPALLMAAFVGFLSRYAKLDSGDVPYPLFVLCGLVPWTFFATAVTAAANSVITSERLITKVYFPRLAIPFAAAGAAVVDFGVALLMLAGVVAFYGHSVGPQVLLAPMFMALILLAAVGLGTLLAAAVVAYRDFKYVIPFVVQLGLFATPSIYAVVPADGGPVWGWANPMTALVQGFRASVLGGPVPWPAVATATTTAAGLFVVGCLYFRKVEGDFADII